MQNGVQPRLSGLKCLEVMAITIQEFDIKVAHGVSLLFFRVCFFLFCRRVEMSSGVGNGGFCASCLMVSISSAESVKRPRPLGATTSQMGLIPCAPTFSSAFLLCIFITHLTFESSIFTSCILGTLYSNDSVMSSLTNYAT